MHVLSFHPLIEADRNRFFSGNCPSEEDIDALKWADAVILPQGCRESLYRAACRHCDCVFPNYDAFYAYPGKTGQCALFQKMGVPHPRTVSFHSFAQFNQTSFAFSYPCVFKFAWGGEGSNVFLVRSGREMMQCLEKANSWEKKGKNGFVVQEYVPTGGRSLRVVVIGEQFHSYWRRDENGGFYTNLARGAVIDYDAFPDLQKRAVEDLRNFCRKTKINLAGFDFLFDETDGRQFVPLFLEINFCFRCRGLGGVGQYHLLLEQEIRNWLAGIKRRCN